MNGIIKNKCLETQSQNQRTREREREKRKYKRKVENKPIEWLSQNTMQNGSKW